MGGEGGFFPIDRNHNILDFLCLRNFYLMLNLVFRLGVQDFISARLLLILSFSVVLFSLIFKSF